MGAVLCGGYIPTNPPALRATPFSKVGKQKHGQFFLCNLVDIPPVAKGGLGGISATRNPSARLRFYLKAMINRVILIPFLTLQNLSLIVKACRVEQGFPAVLRWHEIVAAEIIALDSGIFRLR